jgi:hypothetical protein
MNKTNKELLDLQKEVVELKHKYKMEEIEAERQANKYAHDLQLTVIRIKSAEVRRSQERKDFQNHCGR